MDLALPRMDGWEATRRLKMDERTKHIPIVALTGHALAGHAEGARQAGCDSFVTKPCLPDALVAEIQRMLAAAVVRSPDAPVEYRRAAGRSKRNALPRAPAVSESFAQAPIDAQSPEETERPFKARRGVARPPEPLDGNRPGARQARARAHAAGRAEAEAGAQRADGRRKQRGQVRLLHHQVRAPLSFGPLGIGTEPADVHTVHYRDIAAVVSNTPMVVQDPTRDNVLAHQRVNETVMQQHTVIPMSFGTVFKTDDDIMELLRSAYDAFTDVLNKMQDKFEFGLKVLWDRDQIIREIEEEDEDIRRLKDEISSQKGSTYFARMQYGRLIDAALQARSERYVAEIFEALRDVSVASRSNKPIGDRMIMNAAFLVAREPSRPSTPASRTSASSTTS